MSYDISNNNLRTRIGNRLIADGMDRIQYSVYIGVMKDKVKQELLQWIAKEVLVKGDLKKDTIIVLPLTAQQVKSIEVIGKNNYDLNLLSGQNNSILL
jgi:CRISPR-associated endonuclease Cas2